MSSSLLTLRRVADSPSVYPLLGLPMVKLFSLVSPTMLSGSGPSLHDLVTLFDYVGRFCGVAITSKKRKLLLPSTAPILWNLSDVHCLWRGTK